MAKKKTKGNGKASRCPNMALAYKAFEEILADLCDCGHFDSEHVLERPKRCAAEGCKCPSFKRAFHMKVLPKA